MFSALRSFQHLGVGGTFLTLGKCGNRNVFTSPQPFPGSGVCSNQHMLRVKGGALDYARRAGIDKEKDWGV